MLEISKGKHYTRSFWQQVQLCLTRLESTIGNLPFESNLYTQHFNPHCRILLFKDTKKSCVYDYKIGNIVIFNIIKDKLTNNK